MPRKPKATGAAAIQPIPKNEPFLSVEQIRTLRCIAREIGANEVHVEQRGPDCLWAVHVCFPFDTVLTGRGRTPAEAFACLLERRSPFARGCLSGDCLDISSRSVADRGMRRAIETDAHSQTQSFELIWPEEDDDLIQFAYLAAFGKPMPHDDVARDAYGLPWRHLDGLSACAEVAAFVKRLQLMRYAVTTKRVGPPAFSVTFVV